MTKIELICKVKELERELEYKEKEFGLKEKEIKCDYRTSLNGKRIEITRLIAENGHLKVRLEESPSKMLQDILKALTVKIPTFDLKSLNYTSEKK
jgi:hypothetical protein